MDEFEGILEDQSTSKHPTTSTQSKQKCELCSQEKHCEHLVVRSAVMDHIWSHVASGLHAALYQCVICGCGFESTEICRLHVMNYHQISMEIAPQKVVDCRRKRMADFYQMSMACFPQLQLHQPPMDSVDR